MIGITFLFILFILFVVIHGVAKFFSNTFSNNDNPKLQKRLYRIALGFIIFVLVGDEIVGGTQLAYLCLSEPEIQILVDDVKGRTVQIDSTISIKQSTILKIKKSTRTYIDVNNDELIANGYRYNSQGGWLSRTIAFNGNKSPILFTESCSNTKEFRQLGITNNIKYLRH
ncbi:MAG TPA: hypothetical protein DEO86_14045 [Colwellia sp.]|nr:hypothetical protein [Colwellia sp.]|tara:strand:+ start:145 stop:654 length:510 start_codon:yes stop_codon:yes gene_type:complete